MVNKPIDMSYVYKRYRVLESVDKPINESAEFEALDKFKVDNAKYVYEIESLIGKCSSYKSALSILESLYKNDNLPLLEASVYKVIRDFVPKIPSKELSSFIESVKDSEIGNINRDRLIETANTFKVVDRIRNNHRKLSNRFDMNNIFKNKSIEERCNMICEMVDTYSISPFIKMNIVFEELNYLYYCNGRIPEYESITENVVDYFLLRNNNSKEDIESYKKVVQESKVLPFGSEKKVMFLMNLNEESFIPNRSIFWKDRLNDWKLSPNKSLGQIMEICRDNFSDLSAAKSIIHTINEYSVINSLDFDIKSLFEHVAEYELLPGEAKNIINIVNETAIEDKEVVSTLQNIWEQDDSDSIYYGTVPENPMTFSSDEVSKIQLQGLIKDAQTAGEFIDHCDAINLSSTPITVKETLGSVDVLDLNESTMINYVDENGYINLVLREYSYDSNGISNEEIVHDMLESVVGCINNILYFRDSSAYYSICENTFTFGIKSDYSVILTESEEEDQFFRMSDLYKINNIIKLSEASDILYNSNLVKMREKLYDRNYAATISVTEADAIFTLLNPYVNREVLEEFVDLCRSETNKNYTRIKECLSNLEIESFNLYEDNKYRLDLCSEAMHIMTEANNQVDYGNNNQQQQVTNQVNYGNSNNQQPTNQVNYNQNVTPFSKKPFKVKYNNNSIESDPRDEKFLSKLKTSMVSFKNKAKSLGDKGMTLANDADQAIRSLTKEMDKTLFKDRRKDFITGKVNISLSKLFKVALGFAALGIITKPWVAALSALTIMAKNHGFSSKDKQKLLQEIDIELQMTERELNRCSDKNDKKYKSLIEMQTQLKRKRAEIAFAMAKKGKPNKFIPVAHVLTRGQR